MKLTKDVAAVLFNKPLFELEKDEFEELASVTGLQFDKYRKTASDVTFRVLQKGGRCLSVTHDKGYNIISTKRPRMMGNSWGGNKSFKDLLSLLMTFHGGTVVLTLGDKSSQYSDEECEVLSGYIVAHVLV